MNYNYTQLADYLEDIFEYGFETKEEMDMFKEVNVHAALITAKCRANNIIGHPAERCNIIINELMYKWENKR